MKKSKPTGHKETVAQIEAWITEIILILAEKPGISREQLHRLLCPRYKKGWHQIDIYVARARTRLMERLKRDKEDFRCESMNFYTAMLGDSKATRREKLRAMDGLRELLGLDLPTRVELTGADRGPIKTEDTTPEPKLSNAALKRIIGTLENHTNGNGEAHRE
jgi:hypothetical protein